MEEYSSENIIDPFSVTEFSGKMAKWFCKNNPTHKWVASFGSRAKKQGLCPVCKKYSYQKNAV